MIITLNQACGGVLSKVSPVCSQNAPEASKEVMSNGTHPIHQMLYNFHPNNCGSTNVLQNTISLRMVKIQKPQYSKGSSEETLKPRDKNPDRILITQILQRNTELRKLNLVDMRTFSKQKLISHSSESLLVQKRPKNVTSCSKDTVNYQTQRLIIRSNLQKQSRPDIIMHPETIISTTRFKSHQREQLPIGETSRSQRSCLHQI